LIANTPTQHCVHPGRQTSQSPHRLAAAESEESTI
jgi:hypothetical protein